MTKKKSTLRAINDRTAKRRDQRSGLKDLPDDAKSEGLPPDPEDMNDDRAAWALHAIKAFQEATGTDDCDAIGDLLCNLFHLADRMGHRYGADVAKLFDRARSCYGDETLDPDAMPASKPAAASLPLVAVVIEGGMVQDIISDKPGFFDGIDFLIIDYDDESADEKDLVDVPQADGSIADALVHDRAVCSAGIDIAAVHANLAKKDEANEK